MSGETEDRGAAPERVEPLLADANRLRAKGDFEGAEKRCRQVLALAPGNWEAHELLGDIFYQQRRGAEAMEHYRLARAANPRRTLLEDKVGRASLLIAEADLMRARAENLLRGEREAPARRPSLAALLSLLIPGFGQLYNREHIKGAVLVCLWLMLLLGAAAAALGSLTGAHGGSSLAGYGLGAALAVFFSRPTVWWTLLSVGLWVYAIGDAALRAARSMTGPEDLV